MSNLPGGISPKVTIGQGGKSSGREWCPDCGKRVPCGYTDRYKMFGVCDLCGARTIATEGMSPLQIAMARRKAMQREAEYGS